MVTVGHTTNEMVGKQIFFWSREKKRNSTLHASIYKMNFPRKNPMKMAAITTRSEGRGLVTLSLKEAAEVDPGLSECATFLSLKPSSLRCRFSSDSFIISPWSLLHSSMSFLVSVSLSETLCGLGMGPSCLDAFTGTALLGSISFCINKTVGIFWLPNLLTGFKQTKI